MDFGFDKNTDTFTPIIISELLVFGMFETWKEELIDSLLTFSENSSSVSSEIVSKSIDLYSSIQSFIPIEIVETKLLQKYLFQVV